MAALYVIIFLFILAIVSPWIFPNKMVSNNDHDLKH
jgi:N-terminal TM domain of oligopeptide transport permease C